MTPADTGAESAALDRWLSPSDSEIFEVVARRTESLLAGQGSFLREIARVVLASDRHILGEHPKTTWPIVVVRACVAAGGDWQRALWPAVALEIAMTAADIFDDIADGEDIDTIARFGRGAVLTTAIGLLTLAGSAVLRAVADGCEESIARRLATLLGDGIAAAADGQARSLSQSGAVTTVVDAYQLSAGKSGPLGELAARLGATLATNDEVALDLYGKFGWHLAVCGQLVNDARDVMPDRPMNKQDVRDGCPTVPLVFAESHGAPTGLAGQPLSQWEADERRRIADRGGIMVTEVLAIADRLRAEDALTRLDELGHRTEGLRKLLVISDQAGC